MILVVMSVVVHGTIFSSYNSKLNINEGDIKYKISRDRARHCFFACLRLCDKKSSQTKKP